MLALIDLSKTMGELLKYVIVEKLLWSKMTF